MVDPKPVVLTRIASVPANGPQPEPLNIVGSIPVTAVPTTGFTTAAVGTSNTAPATNAFVQNATKSKTQTVALTALPTAGTSTVAEIEAKINAIITALKA